MEQSLLFQLKDQIGTITFNRPKELNAVNLDMARAMSELTSKLPGVDDMKAIVLRGSRLEAVRLSHDRNIGLQRLASRNRGKTGNFSLSSAFENTTRVLSL